jgi:hypothetical protein
MAESPDPAQVARAARLRAKMAQIESDGPNVPPAKTPESPRDFVHRRMAEEQAKAAEAARAGGKAPSGPVTPAADEPTDGCVGDRDSKA